MGSPALIDAQGDQVLALLADYNLRIRNHLANGIFVTDGGTTQGSGAGTALNFDIDTTFGIARIDGVGHQLAAQTDADSDAGISFGATSGKSVIYRTVLSSGAGNDTPAIVAVPGAVATTGSELPPTDAAITAALTHANWQTVCDVNVERTADTGVTVTFDHTVRLAGGFSAQVCTTEAEFAAR